MASRQPSFQNIFSPGYSFLPSFYSKDAVGDTLLPFDDVESSDEESEIDDDDTGGIYPTHSTCTMVKKRSSLQSIFAPTFLYTSPPPKQNRTRSSSYGADFPYHASSLDVPSYATLPRCHSPPRDLIDDDPFANLASPPSSRATAQPIPTPKTSPRSPLSPKFGLDAPLPPLPPKLTRTSSGRAMPAHQKPAFTPRPSLPSLHTLSQMNLILPKKVRKGKVGAGLPFEPWDDEPVASGSSSVLDPIADEHQHHVFELEDTSDEDADFHFSASAEDEDIDVGLDYASYLPSKHSHSGSTSSTSSLESLPDDDIFLPYDLRHYSTSPEPLSTDDLDWDCTPTPPTSMYIRDPDVFQPGTSADTITLRTVLPSHRSSSIMPWLTQDVVDGGDDWDRRAPSSTRTGGSNGGWAPSNNGRGVGGYNGANGGGKWNGSGDGGGDDRRGDKPRRAPPAFSPPSSSEESEEEESTDEYGKTATTDDDDVPLAQRIPTALKAQRTIRLKVREERDQRRKERAATRGRPPGAAPPVPQVISSSQEAALHASKSIRRPRTHTISGPAPHAPFAVEDLAHRLQNVQASIQPSRERVRSASPEAQQAPQQRTLRPMRSFHRPERRRVDEHQPMPMSMPAEPDQPLRRSNTRARSRSRADDLPLPEPVPPLPRASMEDRKVAKPRSSLDQAVNKGMLSQQRIFVGDRQRFNMVEVSASTNAGEVIGMVEAQGTLKGWVGSGGWMLWEVAQDFGMERPIRSFELLADVEASWNKDKMVNIFVLKLTPLASVLSRSTVPSSSPVHSGYVEWEIKRGKWAKRWMTLREHSLFLAKRDNGKDETLVCSLSNFDAYFVTRLHKAPKPFVFSVKSTDNISFFENTADYLHIFACSKADGDVWMEKILLARSYVLHQERNVLFNPKAGGGGNGAGTGLSRSLTRKGTTRQPAARPQQTLVDVGSPDLFEPGSLLNRK